MQVAILTLASWLVKGIALALNRCVAEVSDISGERFNNRLDIILELLYRLEFPVESLHHCLYRLIFGDSFVKDSIESLLSYLVSILVTENLQEGVFCELRIVSWLPLGFRSFSSGCNIIELAAEVELFA